MSANNTWYESLKAYIAQHIKPNNKREITGARMNTVLNGIVDSMKETLDGKADAPNAQEGNLLAMRNGNVADSGKRPSDFASATQGAKADSAVQEVRVSAGTVTGAPGTQAKVENIGTPTKPELQFTIPRGADGKDATNPFKGWFASAASLPSHPSVGDFAYVKGTDAVAIYECTEAGSWSDSGKTFNPEYEQSFASGEELQDVHIVNDLDTGGEQDLLSAEQGKKLGQVVHDVSDALTDYVIGEALVPTATLTNSLIRGGSLEETYIAERDGFSVRKFNVTPGNLYAISAKESSGSNFYVVHWLDSNDNYIGRAYKGTYGEIDELVDDVVIVPDGVTQMWMNVEDSLSPSYAFKDVDSNDYFDLEEMSDQLDENTANIAEMSETLDDVVDNVTNEEFSVLEPDSVLQGHYINYHGVDKQNASMSIWKYSVNPTDKYVFSVVYSETVNCDALIWLDSDNHILLQDYRGTTGAIDIWKDERVVTIPDNATQLWVNVQNVFSSEHSLKSVYNSYYDFAEWKRKLDEVRIGGSLMKVVVAGNRMPSEAGLFYVRTRYNDSKDIIVKHKVNKNGLITFDKTYVGDNGLTDSELMVPANLMSDHQDSTGPLMDVTQYWHLFAQHGYVIPYISNTVGMDEYDVGAVWKDQLNRTYTVGKVTDTTIYLLPVIYEDAEGHNVRDWHSKVTSDSIVSLSHVSGGSYDTPFNVSGYNQVQLYPIVDVSDRKFVVDGVEIDGPGTYYCNEFSVSESQVGYDPATVTDWFGGDDGEVSLEGAEAMAKFTWSYNYKGAQCCVNTTVDIRSEVECRLYGAIQQQFFYDHGDYKAMIMIPKAKARGGVEIDKPFNSANASAQSYAFYRHENHLKDVNDPIDRMIGTLHNPTTGDYSFGMAAGLSLVSGDTVKQKRIQNCLIGSNDSHYSIGSLSPSLTNKFYIAGFNTSAFADDGYYLPATYFKEINFYVSYFDPNENVGQVYWYKDGNQYVIYCHCQSAVAKTEINVPLFMEGLSLGIVEKTDGATLLTDKVQNGKFFVSYNNNANYIVLKTL